jgi:L-aspartate oxidase
MDTDFLVIGSGIAGLTYALKVAEACPDKKITILTKVNEDETNTKYAQGGIAGVTNFIDDSFDKHIEDTLISGDGLCDRAVVEIVVKEGVQRINELIDWGANFDKEADGDYMLGKEGGHSENRILHHKDVTGKEMERALLEAVKLAPNIEMLSHCFVLDLITQHHLGYLVTKSTPNVYCYGVYILNLHNNKIEKIAARYTMLATGGNGQVYRSTTNPAIATGDGVAMVYRAKGRIENMEFMQFHPTALYEAGVRGHSFLITEAVRGDGGILRNVKGEAFMEKYDPRKDLAPRDIVARAIDSEMKISGSEFVYLDCTHLDMEKFRAHFPNIYEKCLSLGIDVAVNMIPVAPAAHYICGGVKTDEWARTSIHNLFAAGECTCSGLHGANRLASNSLLEAMVFAHRAFKIVTGQENKIPEKENDFYLPPYITANEIPNWDTAGTSAPKEMILITQSVKEMKQLMSDYVGIVRNDVRLQRASTRIDLLHDETEKLYEKTEVSPQLCELRNMITVSYLIIKSSELRKESRGLHYNLDFPEKSNILQNTIL